MQVTFVITGLTVGGAETQLVRLIRGLTAQKWRIRVVTFKSGVRMEAELSELGVDVVVIKADGILAGLQRLWRLAKEVRSSRPDCLVTFTLQANVYGRITGWWTKTPVVSSIRNSRFGGSSRFGQCLGDMAERVTSALASAIVVNSNFVRKELAERRVLTKAQVVVIPNGLSLPQLSNRYKHESDSTGFIWITVGRLVPQKNYQALLEGLKRVVAVHPQTRLNIVGEGTQRSEVEAVIADLDLGPNVSLLGERPDVFSLLSMADAFILASKWEGMPNAVMEAMAHGLPTVATPVGGVPELITDKETGWITDGVSAASLSDTMLSVMSLPSELRESIGLNARVSIGEKFSQERMVESWTEVITYAAEETIQRR